MSLKTSFPIAASAAALALALAVWVRPAPPPAAPVALPTVQPAHAISAQDIRDALMARRDVLADVVRAALVEHPELLVEAAHAFQEREARAAQNAAVPLVEQNRQELFAGGDPVLGNPQGRKVIVEFSDFQCGYCRGAEKELKALVAKDSELKIILKEYPILGEGSVLAARAAVAARAQGRYDAMREALLRQANPLDATKVSAAAAAAGLDLERWKADLESETVKAEVDRSVELGRKLGLDGTPSFVALGPGVLKGFGTAQRFSAFADGAVTP